MLSYSTPDVRLDFFIGIVSESGLVVLVDRYSGLVVC